MRLNLFLMAAFLASVAANIFVRPSATVTNYEFIPEMVRTAAYKAYSSHPDLQGGRTLQLPPEGSLPRGRKDLAYGPGEAEALRAGTTLVNPVSADDLDASTRGGEVFRIYCSPCHGAGGRGDGAVAMRGFPAPPPLNSEKALAMKDGQIFHLITFGQKNMPAYAAQIEAGDRWKAVLYVRTLQRRLQPPSETLAAAGAPSEVKP